MRRALLPGLLLTLAVVATLAGTSNVNAAGLGHNSPAASYLSSLAQATTPTTTSAATTGATTGTTTTGTTTTAPTGTAITGSTATASVTAAIGITGTAVVTDTAVTTTTVSPAGATITASATLIVTPTATFPASQPLPLQDGSGGSSLQLNPFDWNFLTSTPAPPPAPNATLGPFAVVGALVALALLVAGIFFYSVKRPQWKRAQPVYYRAANRFAPVAIWVGLIGLVFLLFRVGRIDFLDMRLWLYLWLLAVIVTIGFFLYWYRAQYPREMARFQKTQRQRQYMPGGGKGSANKPAVRASTGPSTPTPNAAARSRQRPGPPANSRKRK